MYIQSLLVLMIIVFIQSFQYKNALVGYFWNSGTCEDILRLFWMSNKFLLTLIIVYIISVIIAHCCIKNNFSGSSTLPRKVINAQNKNFDGLSFLFTYIIPLIAFYNNSSDRSLLVFVVLIVITGIIFVNTSLFYANPTLILFRYVLYECELDGGEVIIVITKQKIINNSFMKLVDLGDNVYLGIK